MNGPLWIAALALAAGLAALGSSAPAADESSQTAQQTKEDEMAKKKARSETKPETAPAPAPAPAAKPAARAPRKPRKVIVGTAMYAMWGEYPGLQKRLDQLGGLIDDMAKQAREKYGRGIDIAALPEVAVNGGRGYGPAGAFPLKGQVQDYFAAKARELNCYIVAPMYMTDQDKDGQPLCYNVCALVGRKGELVGIYRKFYPVSGYDGDLLEGGVMPGHELPVFDCDFGRVALQICYDINFDDAWRSLALDGAELVIWSTQSPGQIKAAHRALGARCFVLTSTWRNNASLFDPMGAMLRSITRPEDRVFAEEIDLEYVLLPWQPKLQNGKVFDETFPGKVGYRYSEAEDEEIGRAHV